VSINSAYGLNFKLWVDTSYLKTEYLLFHQTPATSSQVYLPLYLKQYNL